MRPIVIKVRPGQWNGGIRFRFPATLKRVNKNQSSTWPERCKSHRRIVSVFSGIPVEHARRRRISGEAKTLEISSCPQTNRKGI
jgi:hypothetical protein